MKRAPTTLPEVARLALYEDIKLDETDLTTKALRIEETLASFKVDDASGRSTPWYRL